MKNNNSPVILHTHIAKKQASIRQNLISQYILSRREKGLTQSDVANLLGIKRPNITRFENGTYNPTLDMLVRIAECLDMELEIHLAERNSR